MKKRLLITTVFLALWLSLQSQELNKIELIKPSAQTASLGEYGNLKISKSTGLLNLSIPIYNIEAGNISVPISLSYNSSGVKLSDIASWVGLKWSLNAGGVICRTVVGGEDQICSFDTETKNLKNTKIEDLNFDKVYSATVHNDNLEPDIYNYNFLGYTGKFVLDDNGKVVICGQPNVKIEYTYTNGFKWIVYTSNGYKLIFSSSETNRVISKAFTKTIEGKFSSNPDSENISLTTSAWYLDQIIDVKTLERVKFHYKYVISKNESYGSWIDYQFCSFLYQDPFAPNDFFKYIPLDKSYSRVTRRSKTPMLDSITFNKGKVVFNKGYGRKDFSDINSGCKLNNIEIFNYKRDRVGKYNFNTEYRSNRLLLTKIDKIDRQNKLIDYYSFNYKGSLPSRDSPARDYWGYYNGKVTNKYYIPKIGDFEGDDWNPDQKSMNNLMLSEIKYPTGGISRFEYESNKYSRDKNGNPVYTNKIEKKHEKIHNRYNSSIEYQRYKPIWKKFILNKARRISISNKFDNSDFLLQFKKFNNIKSEYQFYKSYRSGDYNVVFEPGTYLYAQIKTGSNSDSWDPIEFLSDIFYDFSIKKLGDCICGGMRIKSITEINTNGKSFIRKFEYINKTSGKSSGIFVNPDFVNQGTVFMRPNKWATVKDLLKSCSVQYITAVSDYVNSDQLIKGNPVEYSEVKESIQNAGCVVSKFSTILDYPNSRYLERSIGNLRWNGKSPYIMTVLNNNSWKRGGLVENLIFKENNILCQKDLYTYEIIEQNKIKGRKLCFVVSSNDLFAPRIDYNKISICDYHIDLGYKRLKKQETTKYSNVNSVLTKEIKYNQSNGEISSEKIILNGVEKQKNLYLYPDKTNADHSALINNNLFWDLVGVYKEKSNKKVSGARNIYNKTIHPMSRERLNKYGTYSAKQSFKYEEGMVVEIRNNNTYTCVIKDKYNQIIAYIQNAKILDVKNKLGSTKYSYIRNNSATSRTYQYINELKQKLPNSSIYTFEYIPLIGIVNEIDANGKNTRYSYDTFNRLSSIKDFNGNLVKSYKYNYKR